jgi:anti-sigma B factor antagonist
MGTEAPFRITTRKAGDRVVLELTGELDLLHAPQLQSVLKENADGVHAVVLDLRDLSFIDSTGLRAIFTARNETRERGQDFAVTPGSQQVQRLLAITRLGDHLRTIPTPDEALA